MDRLKYNKQILEALSLIVEKNPNLRFGQILANCNIIQYEQGVILDGQREDVLTIDPFYEESDITFKRVVNSRFYKNLFN